MRKRERIVTYLFIVVLLGFAIGFLYVAEVRLTGFAVFGDSGVEVEKGAYWDKYEDAQGIQRLKIHNTPINYYDGNDYVSITYGSCGSNCFRDWNGLIYRVSTDPQKAYINLYDSEDNYISSFGFGITGQIGANTYKYTTLNFTWTWTQETVGEEYIFTGSNNQANFNWTQEFHFYPNQSMKIKNTITNNLGVSVDNTEFWFIQTIGSNQGVWFNGTKYDQDVYRSGNFDALMSNIQFEDNYVFDYSDLLVNGFNITSFYLGDGEVVGVGGTRLLAIGITRGSSVFSDGVAVVVDPSVKVSEGGDDAYVASGSPNQNFGTNTGLEVRRQSPTRRSYLMFNISEIPVNQVIDDAELCLYLYDDVISGATTISINHVHNISWCEGNGGSDGSPVCEITWNNQPCGTNFDNSSLCNLTSESNITNDGNQDNTWQCWNITALVSKSYLDGSNKTAMVLTTNDSGSADKFRSKEYSDSALWPYINVTYHTANIAPSISLVEPQNLVYGYNESLSLNFSAFDIDDNLDTCWYTINAGSGIILANCTNTTFDVSEEGVYNLTIYVNDTFGEQASDSVNFNIDLTGVSISVSEPQGDKTSRTEIPLQYSVVGNNLTCWYEVRTSIGGSVIDNLTLVNCSESSFDVSSDGDYVLSLYANNSFGTFNLTSSSFSVSTSSTPPDNGGGSGGGSSSGSYTLATGLFIGPVQDLIIEAGKTKKINVNVKNEKLVFLQDCRVVGDGDYPDWISQSEIKGLAAGESYDFISDLTIPEGFDSGIYGLGLKVVCEGEEKNISFNVEILEKKFDFHLIDVERFSEDKMKIVYSLEELAGLDQEIGVEFLFFDLDDEKQAEVKENKTITPNSNQEFEAFVSIDPDLKGDLTMLINLNSEVYSYFVQENIVLGPSISGLAVLADNVNLNNIFSIVFVLLFLVFAFFVIRKIRRGKVGVKKKKSRRKKYDYVVPKYVLMVLCGA